MANKNRLLEMISPWRGYLIKFTLIPLILLCVLFYLQYEGVITLDPMVFGLLMAGYWLVALTAAARHISRQRNQSASKLDSPLIELHLTSDLRARLAAFAKEQQQKPTVAAFELLDREIPRFDEDDARNQARKDNERLLQPIEHSSMIIAVTTEIMKRLFLLSGANDEDRRLWRSRVSETALRIVRDALEHHEVVS